MGAYELLKLLSEAGEKVNDGDEARGVVWRFDQDAEEEIDDYLNLVGCGERRERRFPKLVESSSSSVD